MLAVQEVAVDDDPRPQASAGQQGDVVPQADRVTDHTLRRRREQGIVPDLDQRRPVGEQLDQPGVGAFPEAERVRRRLTGTIDRSGDPHTQREQRCPGGSAAVVRVRELITDGAASAGRGLGRPETGTRVREGGARQVGDGDAEVLVAGVHPHHGAERRREGEPSGGAPGTVLTGGPGVRELLQHADLHQCVDRTDRGGAGQRGGLHGIAGRERAARPREVQHLTEAAPPGAEIDGGTRW
ncbi:hypothetical protein SDC9_83226 [bioreactor metagenome]|uniref:Uncharacterized protein n=1 Tax=bioreactor metagenome TaxID=1076179 RepID=A0A644Z7M6_9ZZZZ